MLRAAMERKRLAKPRKALKRRPEADRDASPPDKAPSLHALMRERLGLTLTKDLADRFADLVRRGVPFGTCCGLLGISSTQFYHWRARGAEYNNGGGEPPEFAAYGYFEWGMRQAFAEYMQRMNRRLHRGPRETWFRELSILERRDPKVYGRNKDAAEAEEPTPDDRFL